MDRVPTLVVSGFLGSGKTSLVRHLLADARQQGVRVAVVSNEFGDLGIDAELMTRRDDDYVEIAGGCVCCRLSDELVETLQTLWERTRPDRVVIETSGVALPFETQLQLWREPVSRWVGDDLAVVVVSADQLAAPGTPDDTFVQQVSSADLLLLNQIDRVDEAALPELEARLRAIEPDAPILRAVHGRIDPVLLFPPDAEGARAERRKQPRTPAPHDHAHFETRVLEVEPGIDAASLEARVAAQGALRAKGFVETDEGLRLLQGVGARLELLPVDREPPPELRGRVVTIRRSEP